MCIHRSHKLKQYFPDVTIFLVIKIYFGANRIKNSAIIQQNIRTVVLSNFHITYLRFSNKNDLFLNFQFSWIKIFIPRFANIMRNFKMYENDFEHFILCLKIMGEGPIVEFLAQMNIISFYWYFNIYRIENQWLKYIMNIIHVQSVEKCPWLGNYLRNHDEMVSRYISKSILTNFIVF